MKSVHLLAWNDVRNEPQMMSIGLNISLLANWLDEGWTKTTAVGREFQDRFHRDVCALPQTRAEAGARSSHPGTWEAQVHSQPELHSKTLKKRREGKGLCGLGAAGGRA